MSGFPISTRMEKEYTLKKVIFAKWDKIGKNYFRRKLIIFYTKLRGLFQTHNINEKLTWEVFHHVSYSEQVSVRYVLVEWNLYKEDTISAWKSVRFIDVCFIEISSENEYLAENWCLL